jgi:two-component system alkaline phosphatase synthesis response regulator PhoP
MSDGRLLIVDDDMTMVRLLQTLLELDGFEVLPATRPEGLVEKVIQERPDLVLMDVYLSDQDGIELLRDIRTRPEVAHIPIIMTSGMDVSDQCLEAGANGFVLKPYSPPDLIGLIREQLA